LAFRRCRLDRRLHCGLRDKCQIIRL
jgi:hypothetical protein